MEDRKRMRADYESAPFGSLERVATAQELAEIERLINKWFEANSFPIGKIPR
jgi:hypothetical protein